MPEHHDTLADDSRLLELYRQALAEVRVHGRGYSATQGAIDEAEARSGFPPDPRKRYSYGKEKMHFHTFREQGKVCGDCRRKLDHYNEIVAELESFRSGPAFITLRLTNHGGGDRYAQWESWDRSQRSGKAMDIEGERRDEH